MVRLRFVLGLEPEAGREGIREGNLNNKHFLQPIPIIQYPIPNIRLIALHLRLSEECECF